MKRDAKNLAMDSKRIGGIAVLIIVALCILAWIDGGEEPLHPIEQEITLPGAAR
ncbi:hypothetical protein [Qipengyuania profundimaris]|uniref:Uncharacterized protein n=1 Tax=Qipengyuania profundimaris TaxID=3067652 RepID=A0ABT9HPF1_9SPHN|nr:hypothetical protein [Qipengyuania sp. G39]MDP4575007.1 hypothetical protein [Qipengyuania sp. G39]